MLALLLQQNSTQNTASSTTCSATSTDVSFLGNIVDNVTGQQLGLTEVSTNPVTITTVSNNSGQYTINQSVCSNTTYSISFKKYGYLDRMITQLARIGRNDTGTITMSRDTSTFTFVNVLVKDANNNLVAGATATYAAGGANRSDTSNSSGVFSLPIVKTSTSQVFSITASGFKSASGSYSIFSGACANTSNATFTCSEGNVIVQLQAQ